MTLQNRVTPFSKLVADPSYRGMFMGNRGVLHDDHRRIIRHHNGKRWIVCVLDYKGAQRAPMTPDRYTELFFFDDVVALAAGHRPCALCRRADYRSFREAIVAEGGALMSADELDAQLDTERRNGVVQRRHLASGTDVPDGAMIVIGDTAHLVLRGEIFAWSTTGYRVAGSVPTGDVELLTPPLTVMALRGGFRPWFAYSYGGSMHPEVPPVGVVGGPAPRGALKPAPGSSVVK
jgi:hypothetical protein